MGQTKKLWTVLTIEGLNLDPSAQMRELSPLCESHYNWLDSKYKDTLLIQGEFHGRDLRDYLPGIGTGWSIEVVEENNLPFDPFDPNLCTQPATEQEDGALIQKM